MRTREEIEKLIKELNKRLEFLVDDGINYTNDIDYDITKRQMNILKWVLEGN